MLEDTSKLKAANLFNREIDFQPEKFIKMSKKKKKKNILFRNVK